jgi:TPP-dependent pyruvate/acetoin dehydrogenase alpha subunit
MIGNKQVYREAFDRARSGKSRTLWQRLMFRFQDHYTQQSREDGERDGLQARSAETGQQGAGVSTGA